MMSDVPWFVCMSVGHIRELCYGKTDRTDHNAVFGKWSRVNSRNRVFGGDSGPPGEGRILGASACDAAFRRNSLTTCLLLRRVTALARCVQM